MDKSVGNGRQDLGIARLFLQYILPDLDRFIELLIGEVACRDPLQAD
jgi:hypothetical protein